MHMAADAPARQLDASKTALLLVDVINDFEFEGAPEMFDRAMAAARNIGRLKERARQANLPIIYVNDNFGRWHENFDELVARCSKQNVRGKLLVELLHPDEDEYFVLKPKFSGFFGTTLNMLLRELEVSNLILTGFSGNICVLFTAGDAYMRGFSLTVPSDCTASVDEHENDRTLAYMNRVLDANTVPARRLAFSQTTS